MAKTEGLVQYEVAAQKRNEHYEMVLRVSENRGARGKTKLLGEAYSMTSEQPFIYFKVVNGETEEEVYKEFLKLLVFRGFLPVQYRTKAASKTSDWKPVSLDGLDLAKIMEQEGQTSG